MSKHIKVRKNSIRMRRENKAARCRALLIDPHATITACRKAIRAENAARRAAAARQKDAEQAAGARRLGKLVEADRMYRILSEGGA